MSASAGYEYSYTSYAIYSVQSEFGCDFEYLYIRENCGPSTLYSWWGMDFLSRFLNPQSFESITLSVLGVVRLLQALRSGCPFGILMGKRNVGSSKYICICIHIYIYIHTYIVFGIVYFVLSYRVLYCSIQYLRLAHPREEKTAADFDPAVTCGILRQVAPRPLSLGSGFRV